MGSFDLDSYVGVHERLGLFRKDHPDWALVGEVVRDDGKRILYQARVIDVDGRLLAVGHAEETRGEGMVNRTNPVENAETSAWGRALANLGYEVTRGIASREEMQRVAQAGSGQKSGQNDRPKPQGQLLVEAAARAGLTATKADPPEKRKEMDTARRDVLQAATGVRSSTEIKKAADVKKALDAFDAIAAKKLELAYEADGTPYLRPLAQAEAS